MRQDSLPCAFEIGRTPVFVACLQAIQDVKIARKQAPNLKPGLAKLERNVELPSSSKASPTA
jgi:hypothetical protein